MLYCRGEHSRVIILPFINNVFGAKKVKGPLILFQSLNLAASCVYRPAYSTCQNDSDEE